MPLVLTPQPLCAVPNLSSMLVGCCAPGAALGGAIWWGYRLGVMLLALAPALALPSSRLPASLLDSCSGPPSPGPLVPDAVEVLPWWLGVL